MKYIVAITANFEENARNIINFYTKKHSNYPQKLMKKIKKSFLPLKNFAVVPEGSYFDSFNVRQFVCDNYRVLYQIKGKNVYVLTILGQNLLDVDDFKSQLR